MEHQEYERSISVIINKYHDYTLPVSMTESCTATSCVHIIPDKVPSKGFANLTVFFQNDNQFKTELMSLYDQGYEFSFGSVRVTCSVHQMRLRDAKEVLLRNVLEKNHTTYDIQKVISNCGIALNYQIDKNPVVFGNKGIKDDIYDKLKALELDKDKPKLSVKYASLNRYYNATKHAKTPKNRADELELSRPQGKHIAIDFFETVQRIFSWYYKKYTNGLPFWDELKPIDYSKYGITYSFSFEMT